MNASSFRKFLFFKLPIAFWAGIRLQYCDENECRCSVRLAWLNQNPFRSMFWAVQGMAAELSTGVMCVNSIRQSGQKVSMLVVQQNAVFHKKAVGKIVFTCTEGAVIQATINKAIETGVGETLIVKSRGTDENGVLVSEFEFTWSFYASHSSQ